MCAYPLDLRERVVAEYDRGRTASSLAEEFGMCARTVKRLLERRAKTGGVAPAPHGGGPSKSLTTDQAALLKELRVEHPLDTQEQLAERLAELIGIQVSPGVVGRELRAQGIKRKSGKTPRQRRPWAALPERAQVRYKASEARQTEPTPPTGRKPYPSDLSDREWGLVEAVVPPAKPGGRAEEHSKREIVNAILYVLRSGCQWRMLPHDFPPHTTVYDYFRAWRDQGVWQRMNQVLREQARMRAGRNPLPSAGIVDSQSAKTTEKGGHVDMTGRSA